jgi:hypothetical protein
MAKRKKTVRMEVEVSVPIWLTAAQARKEVRSLIAHQAFWGHSDPSGRDYNEISDYNLKVRGVRPLRSVKR